MRSGRMAARAGLGLAALLTFAACGGGDDDDTSDPAPSGGVATTASGGQGQAAAATPDPCTLVTVDEVSAALGSPIETPEGSTLSPPIGGRTCLFTNTDFPPIKTFQIVVRTDGDFADSLRDNGQTVEKLFEDTKNLSEGTEDVSGLGDRAYKTASAYYVLEDGVALETNLGLNSDPSPEAVAALKTLTEKAVARV
ncbi:MAG TPA: DUF3558 family protein [Acidimicrobiales bacterium]|nr:DUF3558 family protein [Acidimicrobiales bacterium]